MLQKLRGWKTIIWSRFLVVLGVIGGVIVPIIEAIDSSLVGALIPPKWQPFTPLILVAIGIVNEWLRRITTGPVGAKGEEEPAPDVKAGD